MEVEIHENSFLDLADLEAEYAGVGDQEEEVDDSKEELEVLGGLSPEEEKEPADSQGSSKKPRSMSGLVNIYPFANPKAYYTKVFDRMTNLGRRMSHLVLMTRTAHPNHMLAARDVGLEVIAHIKASPPQLGAWPGPHGDALDHAGDA